MPRRPTALRAGLKTGLTGGLTAALALAASALWAPALPALAAPTPSGVVHRADTTGSAAETSTLELDRPAGTVAGDVLVARVANRGDVTAALTAAGWTTAGSTHSAAMLKAWVLYRVVGADEPTAYAFTQDATTGMAGSISAFGGVDTADPVDEFAGRVNGNSTTFATPAVASTAGNDLAVWFGTQLTTGTSCADAAIDAPSGFDASSDPCPADGSGLAAVAARLQLGAAGDQPAAVLGTAAPAWTGSSRTSATNIAQVVLLRAAATVEVADRYSTATVRVGGFSVPDSTLHEPSGLAASRTNRGVLYVHSESDDKTMVAISSTDASVLERFTLSNPGQWDWEDIATGPCPTGSCVYAGDIGGVRDGGQRRTNDYSVYRMAEPTVVEGGTASLTTERFRFAYPDGAHNAEALLVHPTTGQVYVVTKEQSGRSGVYTFPGGGGLPAASATVVTTLTKVATLQVPTWTATDTSAAQLHKATWYAQVTAGSIHPDANRFLLRTPYAVWEYRGTPGGSFTSALQAAPVALTAPQGEGQGEAIDYAPDGSAYYTLSEQTAPPFTLHRVDRA